MFAKTAVAVFLLAAPGTSLAQDPVAEAGVCAECHTNQVGALIQTGGHAPTLDCQSCHADRRPRQVGNGHRSIPRCSDCHSETGHPPRATPRKRRAEIRNCSKCHDVHGSTNLSLVRTSLRTRGRLVPMLFDSEAGAAPGGFTNPDAPGTGLCEVCHRKTDFYRSNGTGEPHFTTTCTDCHDHELGFQPVVSDQNCAFCHEPEAARFTLPSEHSAEFACSGCHPQVTPQPGPGHRSITPCADCHETVASHAPGGTPFPCAQCHEPHGTPNLALVRAALETVQGPIVPIRFDDLAGRADGSFASLSEPGTGICEVCHTTTQFYRADGSGPNGHFELSCLPCHRHSNGFAPQ